MTPSVKRFVCDRVSNKESATTPTHRIVVRHDRPAVHRIAFPAPKRRLVVVPVLLALLDDRELGHLGGRLVVSLMAISQSRA